MSEEEPKQPLTAGEWARQTRRERTIMGGFLIWAGGLGVISASMAMAVFTLGDLTGHAVTDTAVLLFIVAGSLFMLYKGRFLLGPPVCRSCRRILKDGEFRCPSCAAPVDG